jgi:hypothetical protein
MNRELKLRIIVLFSLCAGAMDASTGLLLMSAPAWTLALMRVTMPVPEALVFVRFIGAFVFSVGSLYLFAALINWRSGQWEPLRSVFLVAGWVRTVVCVFTSIAIVSGALSSTWFSVPLADGCFAVFQFWVVFNGWFARDD